MKLSAIVLVKNEEGNIIDCLDALSSCDEIVIVDDDSIDRTEELISEYAKQHENVKIFKHSLDNDFSAQRKFGLNKTTNEWVLFVDADERISKDLSDEIRENLSVPDFDGFLIPRDDFMWGKELKHGDTGGIILLRLFNKNKASLKGKIHETVVVDGKVGQLVNPILHYPHKTISEFLREINFYSDLRAKELYDKGKKSSFLAIIFYTKAKFIKSFFLKLGFLDGTAGLVHALIMSFHSFLVRGKLWLLWQKKESI